jgi:folate-binding protein YgfZ
MPVRLPRPLESDALFMNPDASHRILAGETLTFVLAPRALWRLSGPDATRYLNGQVTNDVTKLIDGQGCYAAVCTAKGRMEGDVFIARHGADFFLDADAELRESLGARLEKYLIADDAVFEDVSELWSLSHIFGPATPAAPVGGFAIPHERYGLPGIDLWTPGSQATVAGESVEAPVVKLLQLENAIPRWGAELTIQTLPPEAGPHMQEAISYTKGCYVGQETIARLKSVGHVNRTLVFLRSGSEALPSPGDKLRQDDREVGVVTSAGFSPRLGCGIALGYVQRALATEGIVLHTGDLSMTTAPFLTSGVAA